MAVDDRAAATASGPRLVPLSVARLAGNGLFRFVYPFLGAVAVDVGLGTGAETLLIAALALGGAVVPLVSNALVGDVDAPVRTTTVGLVAMFVATLLLGGLAPAAAAVAAPAGVVVALAAMLGLGLAKPLLDIGSMTYVSARVGWARRGRALSIMELTWAAGLLVLAPVGLLAARIGWRWALVLLGLVALAVVPYLRHWLDGDDVTARLIARGRPQDDGHRGAAGDDSRAAEPVTPAAPASAASTRATTLFLLVFTLIFVALESTFGVVGLWLEEERGVELAAVASLTAIGGVGELAGSLFTVGVSDRIGKARTASIGLLACALGFGLLGVAGPLPVALAGLAIGLFGTETAIVAAIPLASEIEPGRRTAFLSRAVASASIARAVAGGSAAWVLRTGGIGANTAISAAAALVAIAALLVLVRMEPRLRG